MADFTFPLLLWGMEVAGLASDQPSALEERVGMEYRIAKHSSVDEKS